MIRRRPIPRFSPKPEHSLRYSTILDGAVLVYPDGREVCVNSKAGWIEYKRRVKVMVQRQNFRCCLCGRASGARKRHFRAPAAQRHGSGVEG